VERFVSLGSPLRPKFESWQGYSTIFFHFFFCVFQHHHITTAIFLLYQSLIPSMSLFDYIVAPLACPERKVTEEQHIHVEWRENTHIGILHIGDVIEGLFPRYISGWIQTQYLCNSCSEKRLIPQGEFIPVEGQQWHPCYVRMQDGKVLEVLAQEDFSGRKISHFVVDE
jgi:hypothetical protein